MTTTMMTMSEQERCALDTIRREVEAYILREEGGCAGIVLRDFREGCAEPSDQEGCLAQYVHRWWRVYRGGAVAR